MKRNGAQFSQVITPSASLEYAQEDQYVLLSPISVASWGELRAPVLLLQWGPT
jgi:hypothetical protein